MVPPNDALAHRADEEDRPVAPSASGADPQLFPGSKADFQRCCGGAEQQGQSHHEKVVWLSHLPRPRTGPLSLTWQAPRAGVNPRFFLTNLFLKMDEKAGFFQRSHQLPTFELSGRSGSEAWAFKNTN